MGYKRGHVLWTVEIESTKLLDLLDSMILFFHEEFHHQDASYKSQNKPIPNIYGYIL